MINAKAVEAFLKRERRDFRQCLKWQDSDIEAALGKLPVRPPLIDRARRSQRICVVLGAHMRRFGFFNDMGTGKSLIGMLLAAYYRQADGAKRFVVLVPNRVNIRGWLDQIAKHAPELPAVAMPSNIDAKLAMLEDGKALLYIETYSGFTRLCTRKSPHSSGKLAIDPVMLNRLLPLVDGIIADESSAIGNYRSLQTSIVTAFAKLNPRLCVFLLSGTPFGRNPHLLWPQLRILDGGWTLGSTLGLFRSTFFRTIENPFGGREYEFREQTTKDLHRCLAHRSVRFPLDQADLPEVNPIVVTLDLAAEPSQFYEAALQQLRASKGHYELCKNAFIRLRQISSGFVNLKDPETGAREQIEFKQNNKLEWVKSQIGDMDGQIIIFHDFIHSGQVLKRELDVLGVSNTIINGQISGSAVSKALDDFTQGRKQVLLLNSAAGAYGSNLQMAKYGIFYESPVPVIIRKQCELRFIRPGSMHHNVAKIDLVMRDTVDAAILHFHAQGENLFDAILNGRFKL